ncbi:hypothetical protein BU16DRAFT_35312 [Lophium mytilinum]|uniref:Uncharacterized protein n=1 Tax=Lophium mytilinum TaxID=390894 RepID=A0A6A6RG08_9PEZI|nr:hypothetical protein BU16DRAFT_35312 [Lophium mytilinum]
MLVLLAMMQRVGALLEVQRCGLLVSGPTATQCGGGVWAAFQVPTSGANPSPFFSRLTSLQSYSKHLNTDLDHSRQALLLLASSDAYIDRHRTGNSLQRFTFSSESSSRQLQVYPKIILLSHISVYLCWGFCSASVHPRRSK